MMVCVYVGDGKSDDHDGGYDGDGYDDVDDENNGGDNGGVDDGNAA